MNKTNYKKILNFLVKNPDIINFTRIKELDIIHKDKSLRYLEDKDISFAIISFFLKQNIKTLESQKIYLKKIEKISSRISNILSFQLSKDLKQKVFLKKVFLFLSLEKNFSELLGYFFNMSSKMWNLAGDVSTDINYYTKRIILCSIYTKIILKLLTSKSYKLSMIDVDINKSLLKVKKFNELKSKVLSTDILKQLKKFSSQINKNKEKRGF